MGVNIFILDRRPTRLAIAGTMQSVGTVRRFFKITELDEERATELHASERVAALKPSPKAVIIADFSELPLGSADGPVVRAHQVIGWDNGRTRVTDLYWDYLPSLGYAVREAASDLFVLHEERDGILHTLSHERAVALGLINGAEQLIQRGQPTIAECTAVRLYISGYAEANCTFDNGKEQRLLLGVKDDELPPASWFIGKKPSQVQAYRQHDG